MMIRSVTMENFRGFHYRKTINFDSKPVVLLSAENGIGKTTTIDAIEWCLTGTIGRLKTAFDHRSTNESDRRLNTSGILKHRDAGEGDEVRVVLSLFDGEKERTLCRTQTKDELSPAESVLTLDGSEEDAVKFTRDYIGNSFYNFHFCDVQKSFHMQSQKRTNLNALFSEFITNYDDQMQCSSNLEIFADDVERYISEKTKEKELLQNQIGDLEAQLAQACDTAEQVPYPEILFYPGEQTRIAGLNQAALTAQKQAVQNCGYQVAQAALSRLVNNEVLKYRQAALKEIISCWQTKGASIQRAMEAGLQKSTAAITDLEKKFEELNRLSLAKNTILRDGPRVIALGHDGFTQTDFDKAQNAIKEREKTAADLSAEIKLLSGNNKILELLSALSVNKQTVIAYRDAAAAEHGVARCPVCGSASFSDMDAASILAEADEYIRRNGAAVKQKQEAQASVQAEIDVIYLDLIRRAETVAEQKKAELAAGISELKALRDEVQPYFDTVRKLQMTMPEIKVEELTVKKAAQWQAAAEEALLNVSEAQRARETYQQILTVLGYRHENETVQQTYEKVKHLVTGSHEILDFSYTALVSKLNAIDSILANQTITERKKKLEGHHHQMREIDAEIAEYQVLKDKAEQRAAAIKTLVEELTKDELNKVGPALCDFYKKLARISLFDKIEVRQEMHGISLTDEKGKNIVNVLSNGQISVFMLAYFFAAITTRMSNEKMKVYFIDDLTACMDDVNMLAFMDLLKYQLSSKRAMDQLFFVTCDDRISKLLKYKLNGRGIGLCELGREKFDPRLVDAV